MQEEYRKDLSEAEAFLRRWGHQCREDGAVLAPLSQASGQQELCACPEVVERRIQQKWQLEVEVARTFFLCTCLRTSSPRGIEVGLEVMRSWRLSARSVGGSAGVPELGQRRV